MSNLRIIGLGGLVAIALLAIAGSASATVLTSPAGTTYTGTVKAESEASHVLIHSASETITCGKSSIEWKAESHGAVATVKGNVTKFTFEECGKTQVTVVKRGFFEIHTNTSGSPNYGLLTWSGLEITIVRSSIFGPIDCTYWVPSHIAWTFGMVTSSVDTGGTATFDISSIPMPRNTSESEICDDSIRLTGAYTVTAPDYLDVD